MTTPSEEYRLIPLTQGQFAKVSPEDFEWLNRWKWQAWFAKCTRTFYAVRGQWNPAKKNMDAIRMHRVILECVEGDRKQVDHANGDTLDNRRSNIRVATHAENQMNKGRPRNNTSGVKGVSWDKNVGKWRVRVQSNGESLNVGFFSSLDDAKEARRTAAEDLHGKYARA